MWVYNANTRTEYIVTGRKVSNKGMMTDSFQGHTQKLWLDFGIHAWKIRVGLVSITPVVISPSNWMFSSSSLHCVVVALATQKLFPFSEPLFQFDSRAMIKPSWLSLFSLGRSRRILDWKLFSQKRLRVVDFNTKFFGFFNSRDWQTNVNRLVAGNRSRSPMSGSSEW